MTLRDDLMTAARFMLDDGFSLDTDAAVRIGMRLAELAGMTQIIEAGAKREAEPK